MCTPIVLAATDFSLIKMEKEKQGLQEAVKGNTLSENLQRVLTAWTARVLSTGARATYDSQRRKERLKRKTMDERL